MAALYFAFLFAFRKKIVQLTGTIILILFSSKNKCYTFFTSAFDVFCLLRFQNPVGGRTGVFQESNAGEKGFYDRDIGVSAVLLICFTLLSVLHHQSSFFPMFFVYQHELRTPLNGMYNIIIYALLLLYHFPRATTIIIVFITLIQFVSLLFATRQFQAPLECCKCFWRVALTMITKQVC